MSLLHVLRLRHYKLAIPPTAPRFLQIARVARGLWRSLQYSRVRSSALAIQVRRGTRGHFKGPVTATRYPDRGVGGALLGLKAQALSAAISLN